MADTTIDAMDAGIGEVLTALVELMRTGTRPDVLEAQRILLQRLAYQGDVFPSRVPAPLNITEVGGYLNLLELAGQHDVRSAAITSALGIAGPPPAASLLAGAPPLGFVDAPNDRPAGPAQPSIPPRIRVRADFFAPLQEVLATLHGAGCQLPLRAPGQGLPAASPGTGPLALDLGQVLAALGRSLEVFPGTVLVDPAVDPLCVGRPEVPATEPLRLVARVLDGSTTVPEQSWVHLQATAGGVVEASAALGRCVEVAPLMAAAGWYSPSPVVAPASSSQRGSLVRWYNTTGLVAGETTLGAELAALYTPADIARSALAPLLSWRWNGTGFAAPA